MLVALGTVRRFHKLSQVELADRCNVSNSTISEVESGKRNLTLKTLQRYALAFGVRPSALLFFLEEVAAGVPDALATYSLGLDQASLDAIKARGAVDVMRSDDVELRELTFNDEANWYALGHIEPQQYAEAVAREFGVDAATLVDRVEHRWGRWRSSRGQFDRVLELAKPGSQGAFRFTMIEDLSPAAHHGRR